MQQHLRLTLATATAAALTGGLLAFTSAPATAADSAHVPQADFNGDGFGDVGFSVWGATVSGKVRAGQFAVLYGSASGVSATKRSLISQNSTGTPDAAETDDGFGSEHAYADFNGDGYDDVAVSAPWDDVRGDADSGTLTVLWGSASGITGRGVLIADPAPGSHDNWGKNLAAGDFDGDGKADLAVGNTTNTVYVYKGGITASGAAGRARTTFKAPVRSGGTARGPINLTAGDVNGDKRTDLIVDGYETTSQAGWNHNYYVPGTANGLSVSAAKSLKPGVITGIGDINGDGYGDIVSGWDADTTEQDGTPIPYSAKGGKVWITYGSASGPASVVGITQDTGNVPGTAENTDWFGFELDLGDINGDGFLDLAVGAAGESVGDDADTGVVTVLYGSRSGLNVTSGGQVFSQDTAGVPGTNEDKDMFGYDVKLDDVTGDGRADLIVGSAENAGDGTVTYLRSGGTKITASGSRVITPYAAGVSTAGVPAFGANFAD
ncbi:VCBS repeat-containing protein [Streptomyces sp. NPDC006458]|uniref:VCBS repeat-containing protein n=1 Tax=Streptomyces sp. NPDC006458 TaxID=3154302 RepID=UPI0033B915D6